MNNSPPANAAYHAQHPNGSLVFYLDAMRREIAVLFPDGTQWTTNPPIQWGPVLLKGNNITVINADLIAAQQEMDKMFER